MPRLEQTLHGGNLVLERLLLVAALVELEDGVDARDAELERHGVQLAHQCQDVAGRALQRGAHRVHDVADAVLFGEAALDRGDVLGRAGVRAAEGDHGQVGSGHVTQRSLTVTSPDRPILRSLLGKSERLSERISLAAPRPRSAWGTPAPSSS